MSLFRTEKMLNVRFPTFRISYFPPFINNPRLSSNNLRLSRKKVRLLREKVGLFCIHFF